ncbi:Atp-binding protein, partial [Globisporangium splendens]
MTKTTKDPSSDAYVRVETPRASIAKTPLDEVKASSLPSPLDSANWLSRVTLWWVNPLIRKGYASTLLEDDVWRLPKVDASAVLQQSFDHYYQEEKAKHVHATDSKKRDAPTSIVKPLWHSTKNKMALAIVLHLVSAGFSVLQPLLMSALFRVVECAEGRILIDGVDISTIKIQDLRKKLTIIPQDPVLFSGSLRLNLDPFNEKSDDDVWHVLRKVHLFDDVSKWGQGLEYEVAEKGDNLSVGQRQLVCIARALLRQSRIIVLDEATANVDQELDRMIQVAVKENFQDKTAMTIAHRLETIADSDRILVLDHGVVQEFDSPANLLAKPDGMFASLINSTKEH